MPSPASEPDRQLSIKIGTLKRCNKECHFYQQELVKQQQKIDSMKSTGACVHDIKKQEEVLEETKQVLPDCENRAKLAKEDLAKFLSQAEVSSLDPTLKVEAALLITG